MSRSRAVAAPHLGEVSDPHEGHKDLYHSQKNRVFVRPTQGRCRLNSAINRNFKTCGLNDLEQLDEAPKQRSGVALAGKGVANYIRAKETA